MINFFWSTILGWGIINTRNYEWRNSNNPFHILIAEVLLQQTNVKMVDGVYQKVILKYATPQSLLKANKKELENIIGILGLKYRVHRLINIASIIHKQHQSEVPKQKEALLELPGVGDYIADAVLCYAYGKYTIPIDTNVARLFIRYFGLIASKARVRDDKILLETIRSLYKNKPTKALNLAVLDYSSLLCKAIKPECKLCKLVYACSFHTEKSK